MNSLHRNVVAPRRELLGNIDSPMVAELCDGFTHVLTVQGVQQKAGNSCGFAGLKLVQSTGALSKVIFCSFALRSFKCAAKV